MIYFGFDAFQHLYALFSFFDNRGIQMRQPLIAPKFDTFRIHQDKTHLFRRIALY